MKQTFDLLASAATIEQIRECIARILAGAIEAICLFVAFAFNAAAYPDIVAW